MNNDIPPEPFRTLSMTQTSIRALPSVNGHRDLENLQFEDKKYDDENDGRVPVAHLERLSGTKLWVTIACVGVGLLLSALETSVIATGLVSISSSLGRYDKANWVVTAYLITYTGFLVVFARLSDLFGRKGTLVCALAFFTVFSLACGLARSMEQLIIFRAFQGIGGAGLYSMAMTVMAEVAPVKLIGAVAGLMGSIFALASVLGPVLGGVITSNTTWRWVFYLNIPPAAIVSIVVLAVFPRNADPLPTTWRTVQGIDFLGITTSLTGCVLLIFALESGGVFFPWNSSFIIVAFVASGVCLIGFAVWQYLISKRTINSFILPLFPIHLATDRIIGFAMLTAFLSGFPFMMTIIFLPQRLQLQNGLTPVRAGINILVLLLLSATGSALSGIAGRKRNMPCYVLAASLGLQMIGLGLMSTLPATAGPVPSAQFGYQAILGFGFGLALGSVAILARLEVKKRDISKCNIDDMHSISLSSVSGLLTACLPELREPGIIMGTITQVRVLGGVIGIAIGQTIISSRLTLELGPVLGPDKLAELMHSTAVIQTFSPEEAAMVKECYGRVFTLQNQVMLGFAASALLVCSGSWKRHFKDIADPQNERLEAGAGKVDQSQMDGERILRTATPPPQVDIDLEGSSMSLEFGAMSDRGLPLPTPAPFSPL